MNSEGIGVIFIVIMYYSHIQWYIPFSLLDCMILDSVINDQKRSWISLLLEFNYPQSQDYELFVFEKCLDIGNKNFLLNGFLILSSSSQSYFHGLYLVVWT